MSARALANEFAKMRHLHVVLLVVVLFAVVSGIGVYAGLLTPDFDTSTMSSWNSLLRGVGSGYALAGPLLIAVVASRLVDVEHQGSGWLLSATSGLTPGGLCRGKLVALGILVGGTTVLASVLPVVVGFIAGIEVPWPAARWIGATLCLLVVNLSLLALHILLAARIENQLVGIGLGLLGTVISLIATSLPAWIAHLTPWGYYARSSATEYADEVLVAHAPSYVSIAALGVVAAVGFVLLTRAFDRQEA